MLDTERFWADDAIAHRDNCFSPDAPQVALGLRMSDECVFAELGEEGEPWGYTPPERRLELNRRYNERAVAAVGRPLLSEELPPPQGSAFPATRQIGELFGGRYEFDGRTTWLKRGLFSEKELEKRLDFVDSVDLRSFVLPENWDSEKRRIYESFGLRPRPFRGVRGPVTLAMSVFGAEELIFLIYDAPELASRFSDSICRAILAYRELFAAESGDRRHGFSFSDDDCCLLTPEMYELFGYPVLKKVFSTASPDPDDERRQHSDSAMGHLLPILSRLELTSCNFGPTLSVAQIRAAMPRTRIDGQLAPFTLMRNDPAAIAAEVRRDCEQARPARGVNLTTAGSVNNGSSLASMRVVMETIQEYGRY